MTNHSSDSMISSITKELNVWGRKQEKDAILGWERLTVQMLKCCRDISDPFFCVLQPGSIVYMYFLMGATQT